MSYKINIFFYVDCGNYYMNHVTCIFTFHTLPIDYFFMFYFSFILSFSLLLDLSVSFWIPCRVFLDYITGDCLISQNDLPFSTIDVDNDIWPYSCAKICNGGFWFKNCSPVRLMATYGEHIPPVLFGGGLFYPGIIWFPWKHYTTHPKYADMKIRP